MEGCPPVRLTYLCGNSDMLRKLVPLQMFQRRNHGKRFQQGSGCDTLGGQTWGWLESQIFFLSPCKASRRFEPRLLDSESRVLTVTPRGHSNPRPFDLAPEDRRLRPLGQTVPPIIGGEIIVASSKSLCGKTESCLTASGYIAQWLERLTSDQQIPGSNPGVPFLR